MPSRQILCNSHVRHEEAFEILELPALKPMQESPNIHGHSMRTSLESAAAAPRLGEMTISVGYLTRRRADSGMLTPAATVVAPAEQAIAR